MQASDDLLPHLWLYSASMRLDFRYRRESTNIPLRMHAPLPLYTRLWAFEDGRPDARL
jgi:hypothetical protein